MKISQNNPVLRQDDAVLVVTSGQDSKIYRLTRGEITPHISLKGKELLSYLKRLNFPFKHLYLFAPTAHLDIIRNHWPAYVVSKIKYELSGDFFQHSPLELMRKIKSMRLFKAKITATERMSHNSSRASREIPFISKEIIF